MRLFLLAILGGVISSASLADIVEVVPTGYTFDTATDDGAYDYADHTGNQLVDNFIHSDDNWHSDVGRGGAYDIVGWGEWNASPGATFVNIDFVFDGMQSLDSLIFGSHTDHGAAIYAPNANIYAYQSGDWVEMVAFKNIHAPRDTTISTRDEFTIDLGFVADKVRVEFTRIDNAPHREHYWTFIDEVDFYTDTETPVNIQWRLFWY
jgi:hypothetical protein